MGYTKTIICLANSYKPPSGLCVAGIELLPGGRYGGWIRPVSARATSEVAFTESIYHGGASPKLLDIIEVPLLRAEPRSHQSENHVLDAANWWIKKGEFSWSELEHLRQSPPSLWVDSDHTLSGSYDCLSRSEAAGLKNSLFLIRMSRFAVQVGSNSRDGVARKTYRGCFDYKGVRHSLSVTDPVAQSVFSSKGAVEYSLLNVYACISLTLPFRKDGRCHKLIASIITNPPL